MMFIVGVFDIFATGVIVRILLIIIGLFLYLRALLLLCPRCKMWIMRPPAMTWKNQYDIPRYCLRCGRDRRDVKPFQFLFKKEPWDGKYHDEGGGEQPEYRGY